MDDCLKWWGKRLPQFIQCMLMILAFSTPALSQAAPLVLIMNDSVSSPELSRAEVRQIFSANKQYWPDGSKIAVFVMHPGSDIHQLFCREALNMFPYQLERLWHQVTYSGQGDPPVIVRSQEALIEAVLSTPGAIGYAYQDIFNQVKKNTKAGRP